MDRKNEGTANITGRSCIPGTKKTRPVSGSGKGGRVQMVGGERGDGCV